MTPERYQALLRWLEARPALKKLVIALNRWLPAVPFACYPLLLVLLNVRWFRLLSANRAAALDFMQLIARAVFVPAFVFLGGTLLRARLNFPRPYEQPGFTPLVPKETHGKSFPSRHALSAAVLAAVLVEKLSGWQIDGIMGILVAAFILFSGAKLAKETLSPLLGEGATKELAQQVTAYIKSFPLVLGCHDLMVHDYGPGCRYASLHVELDSREDPMACHELIDDMERGCLKELGIHLVIHYDPLITDDAELNRLQQLVETLLKVRDPNISIHDFRLRHQEDRLDLSFDIVLPPKLWGQEDSIRASLEQALDKLEGKPYHLDVTFDLGDVCQDA